MTITFNVLSNLPPACVTNETLLHFAKKHNKDVTSVAKLAADQLDDYIALLSAERDRLNVLAITERYNPEPLEPSIFGGAQGHPNTDWCLWHASKYGVGIVQAHGIGLSVIEMLSKELPRLSEPSAPALEVLSPEFKKAGIKLPTVSMAWVIHHRYAYSDANWDEAHQRGIETLNLRASLAKEGK